MEDNSGDFPILEDGYVKNWEEKLRNIGRPNIFIASSNESRPIAEKVKTAFPKKEFEVDIWYDGVFGKTRSSGGQLSNMEWLKNFTDIYDFAIFIFAPEDELISKLRFDHDGENPRKAIATRHNVVFEFGMFLGRIGVKKSFILLDDNSSEFIDLFFTDLKENINDTLIEINTDFKMEIYRYLGNYDGYRDAGEIPFDDESIDYAIESIKSQIKNTFEDVEIGFLPAVSLAIGYFNNLVSIFLTHSSLILENEDRTLIERWKDLEINPEKLHEIFSFLKESKKIEFRIVIPTSLEGSLQENFTPSFSNEKFSVLFFPGKNRSMALLFDFSHWSKTKEFIVYDVPTTMNSSIEAINLLTSYKDIRELLKEKERRNFKKAIEYKIEEFDSNTLLLLRATEVVKIVTWEDFLKV